MKDLIVFKRELRALLTDDIGGTLNKLKEVLPEGGEKHQSITVLEGQLKSLNKQRMRNTISFEAYQLEYNKLSSAILDLLESLSSDDFEAPKQENNSSSYKKGSILYDISSKMKVGETHKCVIRIAFDEDRLLENIQLGSDAKLRDIRISNVMLVDLIDPQQDSTAFSIYTISEKEQFIDKDNFTQWVYYVKPLKEGQHPLVLKVSLVEVINNKERKREIVLEELITIVSKEEKTPQPTGQFKDSNYAFFMASDQAATPPPPASGSTFSFYRTISVALSFLLLLSFGVWAVPYFQHRTFWNETLQANNTEQYQLYLNKYPDGKYADVAKENLQILISNQEDTIKIGPAPDVPDTITIDIDSSIHQTSDAPEEKEDEPERKVKKTSDKKEEQQTEPTEIEKPVVVDTIQKKKTPPPPPKPTSFTDSRDGKKYKVVQIGNTIWMAENINHVAKGTYVYDKNAKNAQSYGRLYRWDEAYYACPKGWRLPSDKDWRNLARAFGGCDEDSQDGGRAAYYALFGSGKSGFNATAGGEKDPDGKYNDLGIAGNYWTITPYATSNAYYYYFDTQEKRLVRSQAYKKFAYSCRCIKDQ